MNLTTEVMRRILFVTGGVLGLTLTPPFALQYFLTYGRGVGERPPAWLAEMEAELRTGGWLDRSYASYGRWYAIALLLISLAAAMTAARLWERTAPPGRVAIGTTATGLFLATLGVAAEYGTDPDGSVALSGFLLETWDSWSWPSAGSSSARRDVPVGHHCPSRTGLQHSALVLSLPVPSW